MNNLKQKDILRVSLTSNCDLLPYSSIANRKLLAANTLFLVFLVLFLGLSVDLSVGLSVGMSVGLYVHNQLMRTLFEGRPVNKR